MALVEATAPSSKFQPVEKIFVGTFFQKRNISGWKFKKKRLKATWAVCQKIATFCFSQLL